jgi:hypothetical protein
MATTTITRTLYTAIVDDDGTGSTGTVVDKAHLGELYTGIDAIIAGNIEWGGIQYATAQPRAVVYNSTTQSLSDSTLTAITFDTEDFDVGSMHSTSVNTSRITCPANGTGAYLVIGKVTYAANATGVRVARIRKGGSDVATQATHAATAGATQVVQTICLIGMTPPSDYVELYGFQTSGGALNTGDAATRAIQNELTVIKLW